ncbi:MAG: hypothetical protein EXS37_01170 [Opitutus sp.]|nr:hypothetical protein [Opitutus sp.]
MKLPVAQCLALIDDLLASLPEAEFVTEGVQVDEAWSRLRELKSNFAFALSFGQLNARLA